MTDAKRRYLAEVARLGVGNIADSPSVTDEITDTRLLIEQSVVDRSYFLTLHSCIEAASVYHDTQESAEDWTVVELVDLSSGKRYDPEVRTSFVESPHDPLICVGCGSSTMPPNLTDVNEVGWYCERCGTARDDSGRVLL